MITKVHLDFEGSCLLDIKDVGSYQWTLHPSHKITCAQFLVGDESEPCLIDYGDFHDGDSYTLINSWNGELLYDLAKNPDVIFIAHNAQHEQNEWRHKMVAWYHFPEIPIHRWRCTQAKCYAHGLPGALEKAAKALHLDKQKDMDGSKVMQKLAKPKADGTFWTPDQCPQDFEKLYAYCADDVLCERALDQHLRDLSPYEQRVWQIDQRINQTGIQIDAEYVERAIALSDQYHKDLADEFYAATMIEKPTLRKPFEKWCKANGCELPNTQAATIRAVLQRENLSPRVRKAVEIFALAGKTSLAKYPAFIARSFDGILREIYQYSGAHTRRFAARGVQIHNLKRATVLVRLLVYAIQNCSYAMFQWMYSDVGAALSSGLRPVIISRPGKRWLIGDYGQIESRVLAWLAGQEDKLQKYRDGVDIYAELAAIIGCDRQGGKVGDLSLGFGGGINAYAKMGRGYGMDFRGLVDTIWRTASHSERKRASYCAELYYKRDPEDPVTMEVALALNVIKDRFRDAHPMIVQYWKDLEAGAIRVIETGREVVVGKIAYFMHGEFLWCRLPGGGFLAYPFPKVEYDKKGRARWSYRTEVNKQWVRVSTWGGTQSENITQAVARDIMVDAMVDMEDIFPWLLHTHDEGGSEVDNGYLSLDAFLSYMANPPCTGKDCWAETIPIVVEGYETTRYGVK